MGHDSLGNTDPQRGAKDADALQKGEKNFLDNFKGLSNALSNDENGFSNQEGFNTDRGHEPLAETKGTKGEDDRTDGKEFGKEDSDSSTSERRRRL